MDAIDGGYEELGNVIVGQRNMGQSSVNFDIQLCSSSVRCVRHTNKLFKYAETEKENLPSNAKTL